MASGQASDQRADSEAQQVLCDWSTGMTRRAPRAAGLRGIFSYYSFFYVDAPAAGADGRMLLAFEKILTCANHVGLYSEAAP